MKFDEDRLLGKLIVELERQDWAAVALAIVPP